MKISYTRSDTSDDEKIIRLLGLMTQEEPVKFAAAGDHVTGALHGIDIEHVRYLFVCLIFIFSWI